MTKICLIVGFESLGSFSTLFNACVGQTPSRLPRRRRQGRRARHRSPARLIKPAPSAGTAAARSVEPRAPTYVEESHGKEKLMITSSLDTSTVFVLDLERAERFYTETLRLRGAQ